MQCHKHGWDQGVVETVAQALKTSPTQPPQRQSCLSPQPPGRAGNSRGERGAAEESWASVWESLGLVADSKAVSPGVLHPGTVSLCPADDRAVTHGTCSQTLLSSLTG